MFIAIAHRRQRLLRYVGSAFIATLIVIALGQQPSQAHGYIIRAIPANQAVLTHSPTRIQIWFTEALEPKFSTLTLSNEKGEVIPLAESGLAPTNADQLSARLASPLPDGAYVVTIRAAFASDGHVVTDTLVFWVGARTSTLAGSGPSQDALPLEVVWRSMTLVGLVTLFGTALLYQVVLLPGWGNPAYVAGRLPFRVMTRLYAVMCVALVLAFVGSIVALLQQTSVLFVTDLGSVLQNGLWNIVLRGTQFGDVLTFRLGFIVLAGLLTASAVYLSSRRPEFVTMLWALNVATAATALGTVSWNSHAAGATLWPLAAVGVDWLHLLATGAWVGGLSALALTLPVALAPLAGDNRRAVLMVALKRFSAVGMGAVLLLTVTGLYSASLTVRQPSDLPDTHYGLTLMAKVVLIVPLLLIALYHHLVAAPNGRSERDEPLSPTLSPPAWKGSQTHLQIPSLRAGRGLGWRKFRLQLVSPERLEALVSSVRLEAMIALVVVLFAALLTATPPPIPPEALNKVEAPSQQAMVGNVQVGLSIDPDASGDNSYQVSVSQAGQALNAATVQVQFVYPSLDNRSSPLTLDPAGEGYYIGAGIELDRVGDGRVLVDIASPSQSPIRAAFRWSVPTVSPVTPTRQPSLLNWLSAACVPSSLASVVVPMCRRAVPALHL